MAAKNKVIIGYYEKKTEAIESLERLAGKDLTERYNMTFAEVFRGWSEEHYKTLTKSGITSYDIAYNVFSALHNKKFRDLRTSYNNNYGLRRGSQPRLFPSQSRSC